MTTYPVELTVHGNVYELDVGVSGVSITKDLSVDTKIQVVQGEHYHGSVVITPAQDEQTIKTAGLFVDEDITVRAIPSNYGLITWNGSVLTIT